MASEGPAIKEKAYEKQNRKMRSEYTLKKLVKN
jgi:hypothetical protein